MIAKHITFSAISASFISNLLPFSESRKQRKEHEIVGFSKGTFVGTFQQYHFTTREQKELAKHNIQLKDTKVATKLCLQGYDIYSTLYTRKSATPTRKDSSFLLYSENCKVCTFTDGKIGRAKCYFTVENRGSFCILETYEYFNGSPKQHSNSAMWRIKMIPTGVKVVPLEAIQSRVMCLASDVEPLKEKHQGLVYSIGMVINHVHNFQPR